MAVDLSRIGSTGIQPISSQYANVPYRGAPEPSTFEKILVGLDKPDAALRATIGKALGDKNAPKPLDIYRGKARYEARDLLNAVEKKTGLDLFAGEKGKDNPFLADVVNTIAEFGIYSLISPTAGIMTGASQLGKSLGLTKNVATRGQAIAARAGVGAVGGALTGDDAGESAQNAVIGALALGAGPMALGKVASVGGKAGGQIVDAYVRGRMPELFEGSKMGISEATEMARNATRKLQFVGRNMRQLDSKLGFYDLDPKLSRELSNYLDSKFSQSTTYRNNLEKQMFVDRLDILEAPKFDDASQLFQLRRDSSGRFGGRLAIVPENGQSVAYLAPEGSNQFSKVGASSSAKTLQNQFKGFDPIQVSDFNSHDAIMHGVRDKKGRVKGGNITQDDLNLMTRKTNSYMGKLVNEELATIGNPELTKNVNLWVDRNRQIIDDYNKYKKASGVKTEVMPIDFHTYEVLDPSEFKLRKGEEQFSNIREGFVRRASDEPIKTGDLTFQERLKRESETFYKNYLDKTEQEAKRIVSGVNFNRRNNANANYLEKFLDKWDGFTGFLKQQQLTMSHSWVVNNFTDNLIRAYMTGGTGNAVDSLLAQTKSIFRNKGDKLTRDLLKLTDPSNVNAKSLLYESDVINAALDSGAINEGFFSEAFKAKAGKPMLVSRVGSDEAAKILQRSADTSNLGKAYERYQDFLYNTVGRTGELIENSARITTFDNVAKGLLGSDDALKNLGVVGDSKAVQKQLKDLGYMDAVRENPSIKNVYNEAGRIVNDTFVDYGNVSVFENAVMKRMFPYWTFFSRNIPFWLDSIVNKPAEMTKVFNAYKALGSRPTEFERASIPDYLLEQGARVGEGGKVITAPNVSLLDALNTIDARQSALEKLHPVASTVMSLVTGKNNLGQTLLPSETRSGRTRVTGGGLLLAPLSPSTFRSGDGKLQNTSDIFAVASMLRGNLLPMPIVDTGARIVESQAQGKDLLTQIANLGPVKQKQLDASEQARTRRFRRRSETLKRRAERKNILEAGLDN